MAQNYVLLERIELNASAASVTFSNIPQSGYSDLKVVMSARCTNASTVNVPRMTFNGTTTGYSGRYVEGDGSSTFSNLAATDGFSLVGVTAANATANTFGNLEVYIPNYTSNQYKSASSDQVTENNATQAFTDLQGYLWSNTAAITSITITPNSSASFVQYSTFSLYGLAAVGTTPTIAPKASGGNKIDFDGTYWIHTFTSSGTFTPQIGLTCDYLVVAGGGGAGSGAGGGGGAGGFLTATGTSVPVASYAITVGAGGAGGPTGAANAGVSGSNSVFNSITATGGGFGGAHAQSIPAGTGGSGGGAGGGNNSNNTAGSGTSGQGNAGGIALNGSGAYGAGGGGGKSAVGSNGSITAGGNGGAGLASSISGSSVTYAGGGGGGTYSGGGGTFNGGTGGAGGGGNAATTNNGSGTAGTPNTGGGGGAGTYTGQYGTGGAGGSGIVIIRYLAA